MIHRVLKRILVNTACGGAQEYVEPGALVKTAGAAANKLYIIALEVQRPGEDWTRLGPFATVPASAVEVYSE